MKKYRLVARVSTESPAAVRRALKELFPGGTVATGEDGFLVKATASGASARDLNRALLSALRKVERRTRLRAEWTAGTTTERFFDYVPKGVRP